MANSNGGPLFDTLVSVAVELTNSDAGHLYLCDPAQNLVKPVASAGCQPLAGNFPTQQALRMAMQVSEHQSPSMVELGREASECDATISLAAVPVQRDGQPIAVLQVAVRSAEPYSEQDIHLLTRLASQGAVAIQNARAHEKALLRTEHLGIVNRIAHAANKSLHLNRLVKVVHEELQAALDFDAFFVALYDQDTDTLDYRIQVDDNVVVPPERKPVGNGLTSSVIRRQQSLLIRDYAAQREQLPSAELWGTMKPSASWLGVPMLLEERTLGVICVQAYRPRAYDQMDEELLRAIAEQVAVGVENTRLYEETSQRLVQCQILRELMLTAASTLDFDQVLERTLRALHTQMGAECIGFAMPDPEKRSLRLHPSQIGFPDNARTAGLDAERNLCGQVFLTGQPTLVDDVRTSPAYFGERPDTRSKLAVPVAIHGEVLGVLNVESSHTNAFDQKDLDFYKTIASQLSLALENARLFEAERRHRRQTEALEAAAAVVSGTLNLDTVLERILEQVERVVCGDAINVALIKDDDQARVVRRRGYETENWGVESLSITEYPLLLEMIETGRPIVVPDTTCEPRWTRKEGQESWRSYVGAPIKVGGVIVGFLSVNSIRPGAFDHQDAEGLQAFAHHAAAAIENAQLYQELHNYADALERRVEERTSQLRSQYAQLEAILDSTTDGIILAGSDGELVLANPVARDLLRQALSPKESAQLQEAVKALAARAEGHPEIVLELTGLDLQLTAAPVHKPTMQEAKAVVAIHDVSHIKALNRMKSRFVSNVSHELRTPIATIKLLAHLMQQQPEKWKEHLDPLIQEAEHQAKLVRDILEMSRVDAGRLEIRPEPTSINDLVEMSLEKYERQAREQELTLQYRPGEEVPVAMADPRWMMQVLNNLLSNAIRYTPAGGAITVATGKEVAEGRPWATITVKDTGIGIPEDELPFIFDRFYRGERPQTMQVSGTGLGLAILKEIIELHGGQVTVQSQVDKGSSFTVWIPVHSP